MTEDTANPFEDIKQALAAYDGPPPALSGWVRKDHLDQLREPELGWHAQHGEPYEITGRGQMLNIRNDKYRTTAEVQAWKGKTIGIGGKVYTVHGLLLHMTMHQGVGFVIGVMVEPFGKAKVPHPVVPHPVGFERMRHRVKKGERNRRRRGR